MVRLPRFSRTATSTATAACLLVSAVGCADLIGLSDYYVDAQTSAGGGSATQTTGTVGGMGGGGAAPCVPSAEVCNGIDDDCDGIADEPDSGEGEACGCLWTSASGQVMALCFNDDQPAIELSCPAGMRATVLQSAAEHDALANLLPKAGDAALLALNQASGGSDRVRGWSWAREGMIIEWDVGAAQPDDAGDEPSGVENGDEQCAALNRRSPSPVWWTHDAACDKARYLACEAVVDECIPGAGCQLAEGCQGRFDCELPPNQQCVAVPSNEVCNGADDNCNGVVDDADVCGCSPQSFPGEAKEYLLCEHAVGSASMHCPNDFAPASPKTPGQVGFLASSPGAAQQRIRIGVYQGPQATMVTEGWKLQDKTPLPPGLWANGQPSDNFGLEQHGEDCGTIRRGYVGLNDYDCTSPLSYFCEAL